MMKESINVTGEPVPDPILGCGFILFIIGIIMTISALVCLLFKVNVVLLLLYGIIAIAVGIAIIVLCLKIEHHGKL